MSDRVPRTVSLPNEKESDYWWRICFSSMIGLIYGADGGLGGFIGQLYLEHAEYELGISTAESTIYGALAGYSLGFFLCFKYCSEPPRYEE